MPNPNLWPKRTAEDKRERAIGEVYGNLHIDMPWITREMVAKRYDLMMAERSNVPIPQNDAFSNP